AVTRGSSGTGSIGASIGDGYVDSMAFVSAPDQSSTRSFSSNGHALVSSYSPLHGNTSSPTRRDEVMEPLCPPKPKSTSAPPPGLSNWLFQ
ncbi:hypothetical protein EC988_007011, partial [Linderina pennispora]